jgi:hypothetical protein
VVDCESTKTIEPDRKGFFLSTYIDQMGSAKKLMMGVKSRMEKAA